MSTSAKIFEETIPENTTTSKFIESLSTTPTIALILPEVEAAGDTPVIGAETVDFIALLRDYNSDNITIDVCGDTDNIHYSQLNSIILDIGAWIMNDLGAPLFVTVLGAYIAEKISQHNSEDFELRVEIIEGKGKNKKRQRIHGKPKDVLKAIKKLKRK